MTLQAAFVDNAPFPLGIIAGKGELPGRLIAHCEKTGRDFFIIAFEESFSPEVMSHLPHAVVRLGAVGEALQHLRSAGVKEVVMAGGIKRPALSSLRPDATGAKLLKKLGRAFFGGDDAILKAVTEFFEEENFKVVGVDSIISELLAPKGVIGGISPGNDHKSHIMVGMAAAKNLGALDIGQAVVVAEGKIVATENADGTDALIAGCKGTKNAILVKAKKPLQEERVDLPAIGVATIERLHECGFIGVAVEAGGSILIDRDRLVERADTYGIFVVGVRYE